MRFSWTLDNSRSTPLHLLPPPPIDVVAHLLPARFTALFADLRPCFSSLTCPAGRLSYFYSTTSPLTLLASTSQLEQAQQDVQHYEGLIKEAGVKGCYVREQDKERYWNARQRGSTASSASSAGTAGFVLNPTSRTKGSISFGVATDVDRISGQLFDPPGYGETRPPAVQDVGVCAYQPDVSGSVNPTHHHISQTTALLTRRRICVSPSPNSHLGAI